MLSINQLNANTSNSVIGSLDVVIDDILTDFTDLIIDDYLSKNEKVSTLKCYTENKS